MSPVLFNLGLNPTSTACDSVTVQLRLAATPGVVSFSANGIVNASGNISLSYPGTVNGNSYYIVVFHRNAVQTWSGYLSSLPAFFDFTDNPAKAYEENMVYSGGLFPAVSRQRCYRKFWQAICLMVFQQKQRTYVWFLPTSADLREYRSRCHRRR